MSDNPLRRYTARFVDGALLAFKQVFGTAVTLHRNEQNEALIQSSTTLSFSGDFVVQVPFSGIISGDYFFVASYERWGKFVSATLSVEGDEIYISAAKEFLNTIVGYAFEPLNHDFPGLTFSTPRIIFGRVDYPSIRSEKCVISHPELGEAEFILTLDLMKQEISNKLEEEIQAKIRESMRAKKAEHSIRSILSNINLGIAELDLDGIIAPGHSSMLAKLFFRSESDLQDRAFIDVCPEEVIGGKENAFLTWLFAIKNMPHMSEEKWARLGAQCPIREVSFERKEQKYTYLFAFHWIEHEDRQKILLIVEEISEKKRLEKRLVHETSTRVTLESQLKMAQAIQQSLLPSAIKIPGLDIGTRYNPAANVGGDWFGYFYDEYSKSLNFYIGDVTGQGVSAALLTAVACGGIYSIEMLLEEMAIYYSPERRLSIIAETLNKLISKITDTQKLMSMAFVSINIKTGVLSYLNAGHPPGLLMRKGKEISELSGPGSLLGDPLNSTFAFRQIQLSHEDSVFFYTDGLLQNKSAEGNSLSLPMIENAMKRSIDSEDMVHKVDLLLKEALDGARGMDDVAFIALKWKNR